MKLPEKEKTKLLVLKKDDVFAPWNDYITDPKETNKYLYESGETDSEYYWKP